MLLSVSVDGALSGAHSNSCAEVARFFRRAMRTVSPSASSNACAERARACCGVADARPLDFLSIASLDKTRPRNL
jgi:hypothetical protein